MDNTNNTGERLMPLKPVKKEKKTFTKPESTPKETPKKKEKSK